MSPATRAHRTTPHQPPPAAGLIMAAAAICEVHVTRENSQRFATISAQLWDAVGELRGRESAAGGGGT